MENETTSVVEEVAATEPEAAGMETMPPMGVYTGYKHCCVIDAAGQYITLVLVHLMDYDGEIRQEPQNYTMPDDTALVDAMPPQKRSHAGSVGLINPRWSADTSDWVEAATESEIAAWEAEHPAPTMTAEEARAKRDELLAETDWTQVLDAPIDTTTRDVYRVYRQALRDVPAQEGFPAAIVWPELPTVTKAAPDPVDEAVDVLLGGDTNA